MPGGTKIMDTTATNRRLRVILTAISKNTLIPRPEFQRRLVWTNADRIQFIKTVLDGFPFPEIYIAAGQVDAKTGEGSEMLVDGQQRMTSLYQYFKDSPDLKLPRDLQKYQNLSEDKQMEFLEYSVVVRDLGKMSIEAIKTIFQKINSTSYGLNAMEIHNARYDGEFKKFGEDFAQKGFFEKYKIFSATDMHRMKDVLYCLGITVTILSTYFNRDSEIEEYLEKYNEKFIGKKQLTANINLILAFIENLNLSSESRAFKKGDFFTLFVELYNVIIKNGKKLNATKVKANLDIFFDEVETASSRKNIRKIKADAEKYYKASLQAVNDRGSRITRGEILQAVITKK
jgi:hypothetical protein